MIEKRVVIKAHARSRLAREKVYNVSEETLIEIVEKPDEIVKGKGNRLLAHKVLFYIAFTMTPLDGQFVRLFNTFLLSS